MSLQTVIFDGFQIERTVAASPAEAFHAYTDRAAKAVWFDGGDAWEIFERSLDFRPGGTEVSVSRAAGAATGMATSPASTTSRRTNGS